MAPFVTIGLPFYNAEHYLHDAIKSVFAQSYQDWELILIDDGSTDRSLEIAKSISDPRVRVYTDGKNRRLAYRLNQITSLARHSLIARMDADDLMSSNRLARQVQFLEDHSQFDVVATGVCSISRASVPLGVRSNNRTPLSNRDVLMGNHGIAHPTIMARKAWFERNQYDESFPLAQDFMLWVHAQAGSDLKLGYIEEPLYYYREEGSITASKILRGYALGRRVARAHGREMVGPVANCTIIARSLIKTGLVGAATKLGMLDNLVKRRSRDVDNGVAAQIVRDIAVITSTQLPGGEMT